MPAAVAPANTVKVSRHEAFVEQQLHRAVARIRMFDVLGGLFGLLIITLAYGLGMILLDRWLELSALVRQLAFAGFAVGAVLYLALVVVRPLLRRVNPYYAAVQVENSLPTAKNSLVSWLDLHDRKLPPAIRSAVNLRAARDLSQAPLEQAISGRLVLWLGGVALFLVLTAVSVFAILGPSQFFSLFRRAFVSYLYETAIATRTTLEVVQPEGGNATVPVGQSVNFVVRVGGRVPKPDAADAVTLLFRYSLDEPVYQERRLGRGDTDNEWTYRLSALEVQNGFYYRIVGGDSATPEYQVQARSGPVLTGFDVTYRPRPYVRQPEQKSNDPNLHGLRGTEVTLVARANRAVQEGRLFLAESKDLIQATRVPGDDQAMRFHLVLDKPGTYRMRFTTTENEPSGDSVPYTIQVDDDRPPVVELTKPEEEFVSVPANGTLQLKGFIKDDYGITDVQLRMKIKGGAVLKSQPYAPARHRYDDGSCPLEHTYQDFIALDKLQADSGIPLAIQPNDIVEYWLEATDNCDFPRANVGKSKIGYIKVTKPVDKHEQQKERTQAKSDQQKHDEKVDRQRQEENKQRQEDARQQAQQNQSQNPNPQQSADQQQNKDLQNQLNKLQDQADRQPGEARPNPSSESKGEQKDAGKQDGQQKDGGKQDGPQKDSGKQDGPQKDSGKQDGPQKDGGKQDNPQPSPDQKPGEPKPEPGKQPNGQDKGGEAKQQGSRDQDGQGQGKNQGQPPQAPGQNKEGDKTGPQPQPKGGQGAGQQKGSENKSGIKPGDAKPQGEGTNPSDQPGTTKSESAPTGQGEKGHADGKQGQPSTDNRPATGEAKSDVSSPKGATKGTTTEQPKGQPPPGQAKTGPNDPKTGGAGEKRPGGTSQAKDAAAVKGRPDDPRNPDKAGDLNKNAPRRDNPTMEDIASNEKDLKSGDPEKRHEAERNLQFAGKNAKDPKVRQAAQNALERAASKIGGDSPEHSNSKDPKATTSGGSDKKNKDRPPNGNQGTGNSSKVDGKDEPKQPGSGDTPGAPTAKTGDDKDKGPGSNSKGQDPGEKTPGKGPAAGTPGAAPGGAASEGERKQEDNPTGPVADAQPGSPADLANKKRAAELQLERWNELKRKLTPDMLKKAGMTEEELRRFDQAYRSMLQRQVAAAQEKLAPAERGGTGTIPSTGVRRVDAAGTNPQNVTGAGQTQAPAEFRNAYEEFTKELSKIRRPGGK